MSFQQSNLTQEQFARLGDEIYERQVRRQVEAGNDGKVVAIDIDTGAFALGEDVVEASRQLRSQYPNAQVWLVRIGHRAINRIGSRYLQKIP